MSSHNSSNIFVYLLTGVLAINPKYLEKCRQWALEDGVPASQISEYVRECSAEQEANFTPQSEKDNPESQNNKISPPSNDSP